MQQSMTILLTTHSMEEADALSDTIGIMYMGRLRAIGTSYGLKQAYGKGYKVDVILKDSFTGEEVIDLMNVSVME